MSIENKNIVSLHLKQEKKILDFSDFKKQNIKFDINKLQDAYNQIVQTKKFEDGGGIAHFGAISLTQIPGDPESVKGSKARGVYWTKPDKSGKEVARDVTVDESAYSEFIEDYKKIDWGKVADASSIGITSGASAPDHLVKEVISSIQEKFDNSVVLMPMRGYWRLSWNGGNATLNPGDTCLLPADFSHSIEPSMSGESSLYRVCSNDDPAGPTWVGN